jgi:hypothetical protein
MGAENQGYQQAFVNGQPIQFEDGSTLTVGDLRKQGYVQPDQMVAHDQGSKVENLLDEDQIQAGVSVVTIPKHIWG